MAMLLRASAFVVCQSLYLEPGLVGGKGAGPPPSAAQRPAATRSVTFKPGAATQAAFAGEEAGLRATHGTAVADGHFLHDRRSVQVDKDRASGGPIAVHLLVHGGPEYPPVGLLDDAGFDIDSFHGRVLLIRLYFSPELSGRVALQSGQTHPKRPNNAWLDKLPHFQTAIPQPVDLFRRRDSMPRKQNPRIARFRDRIGWVINNLDTDPRYLRFCRNSDDIYSALEKAKSRETLPSSFLVPSLKTWKRTLETDSVPPGIIDWMCMLFPDLAQEHLTSRKYEDFESTGAPIQRARKRWGDAIEYFAKKRNEVSAVAKRFYRDFDASQQMGFPVPDFPLLTLAGWIRNVPFALDEHAEDAHLSDPKPGVAYPKLKLEGLLGGYASYKGSISYRKSGRTEPQHNGEIFCVNHVLCKDGFVGFEYRLSHYFDYVNTSEVIGAELSDWMLKQGGNLPTTFPFRGTPSAAFEFAGRAAYPGVNCLSIFLNYSEPGRLAEGNYFLLHKRDETQLQAQNCVHVLPAGGHQPFAKGGDRSDTALWRTAVREFFEELFNKEKLTKQPDTWEDFLQHEDVRQLCTIFFTGLDPAARIFLFGFGLDPTTLKPEVLLAIVINWQKAKYQMNRIELSFNWEVRAGHSGTSRHQWVKASKEELMRQAKGGVQSIGDTFLSTLPAGAACMKMAAKHYEYILKRN